MSSHPLTCPVIQRLWGRPEAILLVFAGGAAECAALTAVDWLLFTNSLPAAPLGRCFDTVRLAQRLFFGTPTQAVATLATINRLHRHVEAARAMPIPEWAYRAMLFLVIDDGKRAHAIINGPMPAAEQLAHFKAMMALGYAMHLRELPMTDAAYQAQRHQQHLEGDAPSALMERLFASDRAALGPWGDWLLRRIQASLLPAELRPVVGLRPNGLVNGLLRCYRYLPGGGSKLRWLHRLLLPHQLAQRVRTLARDTGGS